MQLLATELKRNELTQHLGNRAEVLWEQQINSDLDLWVGYTPHYHKISSTQSDISASSISEVSIDSVSVDGLTLVNNGVQPEVALTDIRLNDV